LCLPHRQRLSTPTLAHERLLPLLPECVPNCLWRVDRDLMGLHGGIKPILVHFFLHDDHFNWKFIGKYSMLLLFLEKKKTIWWNGFLKLGIHGIQYSIGLSIWWPLAESGYYQVKYGWPDLRCTVNMKYALDLNLNLEYNISYVLELYWMHLK
jgi:hypothetical protein